MRFLLIFIALGVSVSCPAEERRIGAEGDIISALQGLTADSTLTIEGLRLDSSPDTLSLDLKPMAVFKPDARIVIHQADGTARSEPPPDSRWFQGRILEWPGSRALVSLHRGSGLRGLVFSRDSKIHFLTREAPDEAGLEQRLTARSIDRQAIQPDRRFECGNSQAPIDFHTAAPQPAMRPGADALRRAATALPQLSGGDPGYWVNLALETDAEYLQLFGGDTGAAAEYAGDLVAYTSLRYQDETDTAVAIGRPLSPAVWTHPWTMC